MSCLICLLVMLVLHYHYNCRAGYLTLGQRLTIDYKACKPQSPRTQQGAKPGIRNLFGSISVCVEKHGVGGAHISYHVKTRF